LSGFEMLAPPHIAALVLTAAAAVGLPLVARRRCGERACRTVAWALAAVLLLNEFGHYAHAVVNRGWGGLARHSLPLHFCGLATYLTAYALVARRRLAYEMAYFWGLAGSTQALITPDLHAAFPSYAFVRFFLAHGGIVVGVCFATFALGLRPRLRGVWITFAVSVGLAVVVGFINRALDSNYMCLCEAPDSASPYIFLPWPWYIPFLALLALVFFVLLWLPFGVLERSQGAEPGAAAPDQRTP
jgi:hypothetical integral membrane protein (TIGR02206 family)